MSVDALLYAVKDVILEQPFGWDRTTCDIMADGHPAPRTAGWFCAIHQGGQRGDMMNALDEYYGFTLTLSVLLAGVPPDRVGTQLLAKNDALTLAREVGFNARAQQLKVFLHMNWYVIGLANQYLCQMFSGSYQVDGFCEPCHWSDMTDPKFVGGEWFAAEPNHPNAGITAEIRFDGARRLQAIATYT